MEAVRDDTLPSTESNKLSSLLISDPSDSNDISKEREEELLNGSVTVDEEDIDEDGALSDDSLRLKLSDDEEAELDDIGFSDHSDKLLEGKKIAEDTNFGTTEEEPTTESAEYTLPCQQQQEPNSSNDTSQGEIGGEQTKSITVNDLKESESISSLKSTQDQDTIMNRNDPRFYPNFMRPNYTNRWSQGKHRPHMAFANRLPPQQPHQRTYYQSSNHASPDSNLANNRYYNQYNNYNRSRSSSKNHHQNYSEMCNWSSNSKSVDKYNRECGQIKQEQVQENEDSTTEVKNTESIANDEMIPIKNVKLESTESAAEEENYSENSDNKMQVVNGDGTESAEFLPPETEDKVDEEQVPNPTHTNDESAGQNDETSEFVVDTPEGLNIEESNSQEDDAEIQNERADLSEIPDPNDETVNCEENQEYLGSEDPTVEENGDFLSRNEEASETSVVHPEQLNEVGDVPEPPSMVMDESFESEIEKLPKVYQCLEEIASMEAMKRAHEEVKKDEETSQDEISDSRAVSQIFEDSQKEDSNNVDDISMALEESLLMEEPADLQNAQAPNEDEVMEKSEELLKDDEEEKNSIISTESADTVVDCSIGENDQEKEENCSQERDTMDFDDNACQSNEDAKAADIAHKDREDTYDTHGALIVQRIEPIVEDASYDANNDATGNGSNTDISNKMSEEDVSSSQDSISSNKTEIGDEKLEKEVEDDKELEDDPKHGMSHVDEIIDIGEARMVVDDSNQQCLDYNESTDLPPRFPSPSLKRNLADEDDENENSSESRAKAKKFKVTPEPPELSDDNLVRKDKHLVNTVEGSIRKLDNVRKFFQRDIKGQLKKLKQEELEELLIQKIVETITMSSEIGKLREQARLSEQNQEATRTKCQQLAKHIQDFEMVLKRNAVDRSSSGDKFVAPIKINRSVGLQVNFITSHGMQTIRQVQQNSKTVTMANNVTARSSHQNVAPHPRKGIKVRSPRRAENLTPTVLQPPPLTAAVQCNVPAASVGNSAITTAQVATKPVIVESPNRTLSMPAQTFSPLKQQKTVISSLNIRSPNKTGTMQSNQQTVIPNGNLYTNRVPNTTPHNVSKSKSKDLIDLTDEDEKTKNETKKSGLNSSNNSEKKAVNPKKKNRRSLPPTVSAPTTATTLTVAENPPQSQKNVMQNQKTYPQRGIQNIAQTAAMPNQTTNMRVVQSNNKSMAATLVNNINPPRFAYVYQSGGPPRQLLITNPNQIGGSTPAGPIRNQIPPLTYRTANGIPTPANGTLRIITTQATENSQISRHPAPLPDSGPCNMNPNWKLPPPAPSLKISKVSSGIVLSWNMTLSDEYAKIIKYHIFAYQEVNGTPPSTQLWKKVGEVMALPLPMACTLTQFSAGYNYYFVVRAIDVHSRHGQYSSPGNIPL